MITCRALSSGFGSCKTNDYLDETGGWVVSFCLGWAINLEGCSESCAIVFDGKAPRMPFEV